MAMPFIFTIQIRLLCLFSFIFIVESDQFETFEDVSIEDVPFLASVRKIRQDSVAIGSGHICAATIIKNRVLLTAAICIYGKQREDLVVVVGSTFIKGISPMMKVLRVADWRYHGLYKIGEVAYNIGLVFTYDDLSPTMGSIPYLALNTRTVSPHRKCELCGWGGQIGVMQNSPTHFLFTRTTDKMYCYTAAEAAGVMCSYVFFAMYHFDAGAPLICNDTLTGVFIGFINPSILLYTDIRVFRKWINAAIYIQFNGTMPLRSICFHWPLILAIGIYLATN